jgi:hypothetical protein
MGAEGGKYGDCGSAETSGGEGIDLSPQVDDGNQVIDKTIKK